MKKKKKAEKKTYEAPLVIYPSVKSQLISILVFLVLCALSIHFTVKVPWSSQPLNIGELFGLEIQFNLPLFAIIPLMFLAQIFHRLLNYRYILCEDYALEIIGILDLWKRSVRLNYVHIRGVEIDESILDQALGIGNVLLLGITGESGEPRIVMKGVANPRRIKDLIQESIQSHIQALKTVAMDS